MTLLDAPPVVNPVCSCGDRMISYSVGFAYYCANCDRLPWNSRTPQTRAFNRATKTQVKEWYG